MRLKKEIDQQLIDLCLVAINLLILLAMPLRGVFNTIERALACQSLAVRTQHRGQLPGQRLEYWILAQLVVVVEVLIAQHQTEDPLPNYCLDLMLDIASVAPVAEALGKPTDQPEAAIHQAQQQSTCVRRDVAAIETGHHRAPIYRFKFEQLRRTLCLHRGYPLDLINAFSYNNFF